MTIEIKWHIDKIKALPEYNDYTNVVSHIHWRCEGTDGVYTDFLESVNILPLPTESFTEYANATEEMMLSWLWASGVMREGIEGAIRSNIEFFQKPQPVEIPLPWADTTE